MVRNNIITIVFLAGTTLAAAEMAGVVSASQGLQLNGRAVPVAGTRQWPVDTGDVLKSETAPVVLTMKDGSRIVLGQFSQAKLELGTVRLLTGTMQYDMAQRSTLQVAVKGEVLAARTGVASTGATSTGATSAVARPVTPTIPSSLTSTTLALPAVSRRMP